MAFCKRVLATAICVGLCLYAAIGNPLNAATSVAGSAAVSADRSASDDAVVVNRIARSTATSRYDPQHPSAQLPTTFPDEVGVTVSEFGCSAKVIGTIVDQSQAGKITRVRVRVDSVQITLGLDVNEWIAQNSGSKILAHENGHRIIAEHFYAHADVPAVAIGRTLIGRQFSGSGPDAPAAAKQAMDQAATQITQQYMTAVRDPSQQVQEAYDRITAHGTNNIEELDAINQALSDTAKVQAAMGKP
jgi:hypothetical protein